MSNAKKKRKSNNYDDLGKVYAISSKTVSGDVYYWAGPINWWVPDPSEALLFDNEKDAKIEIHICNEVFRRPRWLMKYYPKPEVVPVFGI